MKSHGVASGAPSQLAQSHFTKVLKYFKGVISNRIVLSFIQLDKLNQELAAFIIKILKTTQGCKEAVYVYTSPIWVENRDIHTPDITKLTEHIFYYSLCWFVIITATR